MKPKQIQLEIMKDTPRSLSRDHAARLKRTASVDTRAVSGDGRKGGFDAESASGQKDIGAGHSHFPPSFKNSFSIFTYSEKLL